MHEKQQEWSSREVWLFKTRQTTWQETAQTELHRLHYGVRVALKYTSCRALQEGRDKEGDGQRGGHLLVHSETHGCLADLVSTQVLQTGSKGQGSKSKAVSCAYGWGFRIEFLILNQKSPELTDQLLHEVRLGVAADSSCLLVVSCNSHTLLGLNPAAVGSSGVSYRDGASRSR